MFTFQSQQKQFPTFLNRISKSERGNGASFIPTRPAESPLDSVRFGTSSLQERIQSPSVAPRSLPRRKRQRPIRRSPHASFSRWGIFFFRHHKNQNHNHYPINWCVILSVNAFVCGSCRSRFKFRLKWTWFWLVLVETEATDTTSMRIDWNSFSKLAFQFTDLRVWRLGSCLILSITWSIMRFL